MSEAPATLIDEEISEYGSDIPLEDQLETLLAAESQTRSPAELRSLHQTESLELLDVDSSLLAVDVSQLLHQSESQTLLSSGSRIHPHGETVLADIEDSDTQMIPLSPFAAFRKKGWLSVSDLVGMVWCEVQVRSLPFLPSIFSLLLSSPILDMTPME